MGTWGTAISSNDTFADIYDEFFDLYNEGNSVQQVTDKLINENQETINDLTDSNNFWFALAKAQWECKELDRKIFEKVENIILSGKDLEIWKECDASSSELKKREKVLNEFLTKLNSEKTKARTRKKKKLYNSIFEKGDCLTYRMENGKYGGAFVLTDEKQTEIGGNFIAITTIEQKHQPKIEDFINAEILIQRIKKSIVKDNKIIEQWFEDEQIALFFASSFKKDFNIEVIGNLKIHNDYQIKRNSFFGFPWESLFTIIPHRENYEKVNGAAKSNLKISKFIKKPCINFNQSIATKKFNF